MKYVLILSITILGCVQFISVASCDEDPKPPVSEVRSLKKRRLAPSVPAPVFTQVLFQTYRPTIPKVTRIRY